MEKFFLKNNLSKKLCFSNKSKELCKSNVALNLDPDIQNHVNTLATLAMCSGFKDQNLKNPSNFQTNSHFTSTTYGRIHSSHIIHFLW